MALNEFMSRQVRRKQQPEFNPGLVPGVASFSPLPRRTRILIIHTSLPLHFISYCCHCTLSLLSSLHCHLHPCDLCSPALPAPGLRTTPGQPREFYAHTMKRFSHLSSHRPGPFKLSPQAESRCLRKDNEFPGKMFGLIGYGAGSGTGVH